MASSSEDNVGSDKAFDNSEDGGKEALIKSFLPFLVTLSVTDFRVFLETAKRLLRINQHLPNRFVMKLFLKKRKY